MKKTSKVRTYRWRLMAVLMALVMVSTSFYFPMSLEAGEIEQEASEEIMMDPVMSGDMQDLQNVEEMQMEEEPALLSEEPEIYVDESVPVQDEIETGGDEILPESSVIENEETQIDGELPDETGMDGDPAVSNEDEFAGDVSVPVSSDPAGEMPAEEQGDNWIQEEESVSSETIVAVGIELDVTQLEMAVGDSYTLTASLIPADAEYQDLIWSSSDETVAAVSDGIVTAHAVGSASIDVETPDGLHAECAVSVIEEEYVDLDVQYANIVSSGKCGDNLTWTLDDEGTLIISGTGEITRYGSWGQDIKHVVIEEGVTGIGSHIFSHNNLVNVALPDSLTSIGDGAFYYCSELTSINIPNGVTSIGDEIFYGCTSLINITLSDSLTSIGNEAFGNCTHLIDLTIPNSVTRIGERAFYGCESLANITLPDSITSIENYTFRSCRGLTSISIPNSVTSIGASAFGYCTGLTNILLPDSVTSIGNSAFNGCWNLISISIPNGVTSIGNNAFGNCSTLTRISIPSSVTSIGERTFEFCSRLANIVMSNNLSSIGFRAFESCRGLTSISIPNSVTKIDAYAFVDCESLTDVFYDGTQQEWKAIEINKTRNEPLLNAAIHFKPDIPVTGLRLLSSEESLSVSQYKTLSVIVSPENATYKSVIWLSSNPSIVSVDKNGRIWGMKAGSANITAISADGSGQEVTCHVTVTEQAGTTQMYRLYNPRSGEHFYTSNTYERNELVRRGPWKYEGVAWNAPVRRGFPVYRMYSPKSKAHHYTMDMNERDVLCGMGKYKGKGKGWNFEGIGWLSAIDAKSYDALSDAEKAQYIPLYRLYNPRYPMVSAHHYTADTNEVKVLTTQKGWKYEGIAWYGAR